MNKKVLTLAVVAIIAANHAQADLGDLLITELAIASTEPDYLEAEFVEIYNNGDTIIDLSDVYLTDASFQGNSGTPPAYYYEIVKGNGNGGGTGNFFDFHARFPNGATIEPGDYQTISINGSTGFINDYGVTPTYELYEDGGSADGIPEMREAFPGSIANVVGFSDNGEVVVMYTWDGTSDLVQDLDYIVWGDRVEGVDKSGVSIDSITDADNTTSSYLNDTPRGTQPIISSTAHAIGNTWQRIDLTEGSETSSGGNGINGHDETSENTNMTFFESSPTPNMETNIPPPGSPNIILNEVDAVGSTEFIEIYDGGNGNTNLDGVSVVLYDGSNDQAYAVYDLTGLSTDNTGFFLLGNASAPAPDVVLDEDSLQDGADAVAIYFNSSIAVDDAVSTDDIIDAFVYDSDDPNDSGLLALLNPNEPQINENSGSDAANQSNARCTNGTGGALNTSTYLQVTPTPGSINNVCPNDYYATVTPGIVDNPAMLRSTLHNIIDGHDVQTYSFACTMLSFADQDPVDSNKVRMLYSNESFTWQGNCSGPYNREHTWPRSRFFGDESTPTNSDAHHLMMSNKNYNSARGSLAFDDCNDSGCDNDSNFGPLTTVANHGVGGSNERGDSNWQDGTKFEVWDFRKGDIARAMFYVDVRYSGDVNGEYDLELTDDPAFYNTPPFMGKLSTLCEWHKLDPVDDIERLRNEVVYGYQDNRNPFIDHPEWVEKVFSDTPACLSDEPSDIIFTSGFEQPTVR